MGIINTYVAYRFGKKGLGVFRSLKKDVNAWANHKKKILERGCHQGAECALWWAVQDVRSYTMPDGVYLKIVQDELDWHKQQGVPVTPPINNWRTSYTVISAMCYEMGEEYAVRTASPALKLLYDNLDHSGYETRDGCWMIADQLTRKGGHRTIISTSYATETDERRGFKEVFLMAAEEEEGLEPGQLELDAQDYSINVAGLY